jgi:predicted nucleic acid-binding Zn ribbon protein
MPTYTYECPVCGEFEYEHSIKEELDTCPICTKDKNCWTGNMLAPPKVKRLISSGGSFILVGSGWAKDNYH